LTAFRDYEITINMDKNSHLTKSVLPTNETPSEDVHNGTQSEQSDVFQVRLKVHIPSMSVTTSSKDD